MDFDISFGYSDGTIFSIASISGLTILLAQGDFKQQLRDATSPLLEMTKTRNLLISLQTPKNKVKCIFGKESNYKDISEVFTQLTKVFFFLFPTSSVIMFLFLKEEKVEWLDGSVLYSLLPLAGSSTPADFKPPGGILFWFSGL